MVFKRDDEEPAIIIFILIFFPTSSKDTTHSSNISHNMASGSSSRSADENWGTPGYLPRGGACVSCRRRKMVSDFPKTIVELPTSFITHDGIFRNATEGVLFARSAIAQGELKIANILPVMNVLQCKFSRKT